MLRLFQLELPLFGALRGPAPEAAPPEERRCIPIAGRAVDYTIRRSARRRTLGLTIDTRGLRVAAPLKARQADIERLILANAAWVAAKLAEWQAPEHAARRAWSFADPLPYLGVPRAFRLAPGRPALAVFDDMLILTVPRPEAEAKTRQCLAEMIKREARSHFGARLAHYSDRLGVPVPALRLTRAATRWGSCARDTDGSHRVSLNWRMMHLAPRLIDYVVAHEVAHVRHMHHGERFWSAVGRLVPDYEAARAEMRLVSLQLPEI
ncbi:MAG: M48 family metallopeptidase [Burkholderiales bacterium]|nr:M48 family metallopeptidase [Burkholderiales bacterium]